MTEHPWWVYTPLDMYRAPLNPAKCHYLIYGPHRLDVVGRQCSRNATTTLDGYPVCAVHKKRLEAR